VLPDEPIPRRGNLAPHEESFVALLGKTRKMRVSPVPDA
jgi:hypothetical protein